jgi:hypothetical protein
MVGDVHVDYIREQHVVWLLARACIVHGVWIQNVAVVESLMLA